MDLVILPYTSDDNNSPETWGAEFSPDGTEVRIYNVQEVIPKYVMSVFPRGKYSWIGRRVTDIVLDWFECRNHYTASTCRYITKSKP